MRINLLYITLFLLSLWVLSFGYEDDLYKTFSVREVYNLYNLLNNPALLRITGQNDWVDYHFYGGKQENGYRRTFDPERLGTGGMEIYSYKVLDDKSALASRIIFETMEQVNLYRSLEKDFYHCYFAYTDTTTGNVRYTGPQLTAVYSREILSGLSTGLQLDYGIERGLKDVYTKCETIDRNISIQWGLVYRSSGGLFLGTSIRYFDRQVAYEAVKEISDAVVNTYMGYHIYYPEHPRSTNEKKKDNRGIEINAQFSKIGFLLPYLKLDIVGGLGEMENCIDTGSLSKPTRRGYWVRQGNFLNAMLTINQKPSQLALVLMAGMKRYYDWASPQDYNVINIENDVNDIQYGVKMVVPLQSIRLAMGYEAGFEDVDYREYTANFTFDEKLARSLIFSDIDVQINQITWLQCGIWISQFEPYFYWNANSIKTRGVELGFERQFVFGEVGTSLYAEFWKPADTDSDIEKFGIHFTYCR